MDEMKDDEVMDLISVAREVKVSYSRLWSRAASGQIPASRTAWGWRVRRADLDMIREVLTVRVKPQTEGE